MIKTFRGLLADGAQDRIRLKTNKGNIGYRIVKFQGLEASANTNTESTMKIHKIKQTSIVDEIDFTDGDLLAAMVIIGVTSGAPEHQIVIFDSEIFNQDIYISVKGADYSASVNYYIELEQVKLNENESTMATLQSIRDVAETRSFG